jgi:glyoxylase-like metal-dependent hydrolase (beta-lactamase superfamily II)
MGDDLVHDWLEVGERVFTIRYRFYDQQIGLVLGRGAALVIDTRSTFRQARRLLEDVRRLTRDPVTTVVDTHWHYDHSFGNAVFRPASIWGHERCAARLRADFETARSDVAANEPALAADLAEVTPDPPERTFEDAAVVEVGGRPVELRYLGRGHTDNDIVVRVPDAAVLFAGDLLENGATPYFGDGYPIDWPDSVAAMLPLIEGAVVPGHGAVVGRGFAEAQLEALRDLVALARRVEAGELDREAALAAATFDLSGSAEPLDRAVSQLRGELDSA